MNLEEYIDPVLITNLVTIAGLIVAVFVALKQRAKIIINAIRTQKEDEEHERTAAELAEEKAEKEVLIGGINTMMDTLNLIVQASKMTPQDKAKIAENATLYKHRFQTFLDKKQERIEEMINKGKEFQADASALIDLAANMGGSILEKYADDTEKQ